MISVSPPNLSDHTCLNTPKLPPPLPSHTTFPPSDCFVMQTMVCLCMSDNTYL